MSDYDDIEQQELYQMMIDDYEEKIETLKMRVKQLELINESLNQQINDQLREIERLYDLLQPPKLTPEEKEKILKDIMGGGDE